MKRETFSHRVRAILERDKITQGELAQRSELDGSLVSKLLTDTDASRREPRIEHIIAIASALEITPRELVAGTEAEKVLGEWIPRAELAAESKIRAQAQARATNLETELVGAKAEASAAKVEITSLTRRLGELEAAAGRELATTRIALQRAEAKLAATASERDAAVRVATQGQVALSTARSHLLQAQRELTAARGAASAGWIT
ncbi:MAG TPA: helix-turn-helix transcriptional regulator, partial [Polyangiaceae bacterium]|nr:helix-turn-helix transcriptional regulator [Polyangiaceae bacterium]